ncbi:caspase family protein, partial [Microbispora rosea]|uniref:wHTH domain-containing protein n=1 Tax=Microbispora rosea TaxID=58117 RepID=UPI003445AA36
MTTAGERAFGGSRFRALLIGVSHYVDDAIKDLPFVESDMAALETVLRGVGYEVQVHDVGRTDRDSIDTAVELFIADAMPGQTLLIYLSGHGVHHSGMDYLVPSGALTRSRDFPSRCVPITFGRYVEHSRAGDVLVVIDACREGIDLREMGAVNAASWSDRRVERTGSRRFAYVYACSPGERARYVTAGAATFSLFSRALAEIVGNEDGPRSLSQIKPALQDALDGLTSESKVPRQLIRVLTETDTEGFVVFSRAGQRDRDAGRNDWGTLARDHVAWKQVGDGRGAEDLRESTIALVEHLAANWKRDIRALNGDPWRDRHLALRMNSKIRWLLQTVLNPEKLELSPAEAALLVAFPFLHESFWARHAARLCHVDPADLAGDGFEEGERFRRFAAGHGRLLRRARRAAEAGDSPVVSAVGWWLFHRWLARQPDCYQPRHVSDLLVSSDMAESGDAAMLVGEVFAPDRMLEMLRVLRMDAAFLTRSDRTSALSPVRQVAGGTENEQDVREQLLGYLLTAAYLFTVDPTGLPETVVDHLGISYAVDIADVHTTIKEAKWVAQGRTRILEARCAHPAVELALREHAGHIDALLTEIDTTTGDSGPLAPLTDMPVHVTGDRVLPATLADGSRAYDSSGFRFRLADDRIQELLMGAQLYGDPALAIRELYQNALDACRYRQARGDYLQATGTRLAPWTGEIVFTQGVDEHGRPYLDCIDNGIGMGIRELLSVFSHAGVRFTDLPEFIEEQAQWKEAGITLYPNSRFGIGVLSYFMLADDITVTTCRFDRTGRPSDILEVQIAGPGALFRVRPLGPGDHSFTRVRLHLRDTGTPVSCVDLLRRILWISEYQVTATDPHGTHVWRAGELSEVAPIGSDDPLAEGAQRAAKDIDATSTPDVWWCDSPGAVLADGLWAGRHLFGAVVNLTGPHTPRLTVDRKQMLAFDEARVKQLLQQEAAALMPEQATVLTHKWLSELVNHDPVLADAIFEKALAIPRRPWIVAGEKVDISVVGCFPYDAYLFGDTLAFLSYSGTGVSSYRRRHVPECVSTWRASAWSKAGLIRGMSVASPADVVVARPSDFLLVSHDPGHGDDEENSATFKDISASAWLYNQDPVPTGHLIAAALATGRSPAVVAARLKVLGFSVPDPTNLPANPDLRDPFILSRDRDGSPPWLAVDEAVPLEHVITAAAATRWSPAVVAARLKVLGFSVPDPTSLPDSSDSRDPVILSRDRDGVSPWLAVGEGLPLGHLVAAAAATGRSPAVVAARLKAFGFSVPDPTGLPGDSDSGDHIVISRDLGGSPPWLAVGEGLPLGHVVAAAVATGRSPAAVGARLKAFGFSVPDPTGLPGNLDSGDSVIVSRDLDGIWPWLASDQPVPLGHVVAAAVATRWSPAVVAARLKAFGFSVPDLAGLPADIDSGDSVIVSLLVDGSPPWLAVDEVVPLGHVVVGAVATGRSPAVVAARLKAFGFSVPDLAGLPADIDSGDS